MLAHNWQRYAVAALLGCIVLTGAPPILGPGHNHTQCGSQSGAAPTADSSPTVSPGEPGTLTIGLSAELNSTGSVVEGSSAPTNPADPAGDGSATCSGNAIAVLGSFTGPNGALAQNVLDGSRLAVDTHNAANSGCQVELKQFDIATEPANATKVAQQIADDPSIVGVVGPTFSSEMKAAGSILNTAGVATLTPSATGTDLAKNGWTNFFRGVANNYLQGSALGGYLVDHGQLLQGLRPQ